MLPNKEKQLSNSERVFIFCLYLKNRHAEHSAEWFEDVVNKINARRSDITTEVSDPVAGL